MVDAVRCSVVAHMQAVVMWTLMMALNAEGCYTRLPYENLNSLLRSTSDEFAYLHNDITVTTPPMNAAQVTHCCSFVYF